MFSYRVDERRGEVFTSVSGTLTNDDLLSHVRAVLADPRIADGAKAMIDFRGVSDFQVTAEALKDAAELFRREPKFARTAFVTGADVVFGMGRMYEQLRAPEAPTEVGVFSDYQKAELWLQRS